MRTVALTGYSARAKVKTNHSSTSDVIDFSDVTTPIDVDTTTNSVRLVLTAAETALLDAGRYVWDVEIEDADGVVTRLVQGTFTVSPEVTKLWDCSLIYNHDCSLALVRRRMLPRAIHARNRSSHRLYGTRQRIRYTLPMRSRTVRAMRSISTQTSPQPWCSLKMDQAVSARRISAKPGTQRQPSRSPRLALGQPARLAGSKSHDPLRCWRWRSPWRWQALDSPSARLVLVVVARGAKHERIKGI